MSQLTPAEQAQTAEKTAVLWTADEAARATGGRLTGTWSATGVSIDTRSIVPGELFVALTAARDGHDFVANALAKGAAAALVSRVPEGLDEGAPLLLVDDVQSALEALGRAARARFKGRLVAVTGSVGKTSTKEMLRTVLGEAGSVHAAEKSFNNHWGVPLTLARMPADADFAVVEIGMNAPGEIEPLARMACPDVALITTVAAAHLEAFGSLRGIAEEKAAIFKGLARNGVAIFNGDLPVSELLSHRAEGPRRRLLSFGEAEGNSYRVEALQVRDHCTVVEGTATGSLGETQPVLFKVQVPGRHFAVNAMGVLAVAEALWIDRARVVAAIGLWQAGAGRGAREIMPLDAVDSDQVLELIDDCYNANPSSLAAALEVLAATHPRDGLGRINHGRRIAYLGDMKELGGAAEQLHVDVAHLAAVAQVDTIHCIGPLMRHLWEALPLDKRGRWAESVDAILPKVVHDLDAGDVVLVKGSNSMHLARVVDAIRKMRQLPAGGEV